MIWFTSDTHFRHRNIIRFCNRPFETIEDHDEGLISRWNEVVGIDDIVYHLGDFMIGRHQDAPAILERLNGKEIHLIHGNHDPKQVKNLSGWASSTPYAEIKIDGEHIVLSHYGFRVWNRSHHGAWHFYGHSHGGLPGEGRSLDVGVDCWDYRPVSFDQIKARVAENGQMDVYKFHHGEAA